MSKYLATQKYFWYYISSLSWYFTSQLGFLKQCVFTRVLISTPQSSFHQKKDGLRKSNIHNKLAKLRRLLVLNMSATFSTSMAATLSISMSATMLATLSVVHCCTIFLCDLGWMINRNPNINFIFGVSFQLIFLN